MSLDEFYKIIYAVATLGGGALIGLVTAKMARSTGREANELTGQNNMLTQYQGLVDQVQEERTAKAKELDEIRRKVDAMEQRETAREENRRKHDGIMRRYISQLHKHIYDGNPPPPPPVPAELQD